MLKYLPTISEKASNAEVYETFGSLTEHDSSKSFGARVHRKHGKHIFKLDLAKFGHTEDWFVHEET